jgi:signal transduction histidine kinase/ActR/RegA family two-component response regulator
VPYSSYINSQIYSSTTRKYAFALSLIAVLSFSAYIVMHRNIKEQEHQASLINKSGRQRMLSQRMALLASNLSEQNITELGVKAELKRNLDLFVLSHAELSHEAQNGQRDVPEIREAYFGEAEHLDRDVKAYSALIEQLLESAPKDPARRKLLEQIQEEALHSILPKLDQVVSIQQRYSELQVGQLRQVETGILVFTILLLLVEVFFIFRPMATSISKLLQEAQEAQEAAVLAANQKSAFLATISHEIRTPLVGVSGLLEHLIQGEVNSERVQQLRTLRNLSENLVALVNDILDYSKIEAGKLNFEVTEFEITSAVGDIQKLFSNAAEGKRVLLRSKIDADVPPVLRFDPLRIRQVLTNFVSNALKFTPSGGSVSVRLKRADRLPLEGHFALRVEVSDTGIGLSQNTQARLFNRYAQADDSVSRKYGGTGLGLSICKQIVEQAGGRIGVISEEGKGSTFWFELDLLVSEVCLLPVREAAPLAKNLLAGKTVLLAEDDDINREMLTLQLKTLGATPMVTRDGQEALNLLRTNSFDLILMDCEMPVLDGYMATRKLREMEKARGLAHSPVVALTSHSGEEARKKCLAAGMDSFICKPVKNAVLASELLAVLEGKSANA